MDLDSEHYDKVRRVLAVLQDEHGLAGREIPGTLLLLPAEVQIDGEKLLYRPAGFWRMLSDGKLGTSEDPELKRKVTGALDEFVGLAFPTEAERRSSSDIAEFAKKWGGLWLCDHGLHYSHQRVGNLLIDPSGCFTRCMPTVAGGMFAEPVKAWRELAARAFNAMRLAASLRRETDPEMDRTSRRLLVQIVNKWVSDGGVTVRFVDTALDRRWPEGVELGFSTGGDLYGVLAAQLAMAITLSRQLYVCAECGRLFTPDPIHRPRTGRRAFCLQCGRPAAVRHAMRDMRRQKKTEKLSVDETAAATYDTVDATTAAVADATSGKKRGGPQP